MPLSFRLRPPCAALVALNFLLAASPAAQGALWTVAQGGGADFTEIQAAVDAAADGDVLEIASGFYAPVAITGKGLTLLGKGAVTIASLNPGGPPEVLAIEGLGPAQSVVIDGLAVFRFQPGQSGTVRIEGCAGPVWLQNMFVDSYGAEALAVEASSSVVLDRCLLQTNLSSPGPSGEPHPAPGARAEHGARVFAYGTDFRGSHGFLTGAGLPLLSAPLDGGAGLVLVDSEAHLTGGALHGGTGSSFDTGSCLTAGDGGAAAELATAGGSGSLLVVAGTLVEAGGQGFFEPGCGAPVPGVPFDVQAGSVVDAGGPARLTAMAEGSVEAGALAHASAAGAPGDLFFLFASGAPAPALSLPLSLSSSLDLHLALAPLVLVHAQALPTGLASFALPTPFLPIGVAVATPALQGLFVDTLGAPHASTPHALALLAR